MKLDKKGRFACTNVAVKLHCFLIEKVMKVVITIHTKHNHFWSFVHVLKAVLGCICKGLNAYMRLQMHSFFQFRLLVIVNVSWHR